MRCTEFNFSEIDKITFKFGASNMAFFNITTSQSLSVMPFSISIALPLNPGNYSLIFSGVGLGEQVSTLTVGSAKAYTVDVTMSEKVSKLDEVVVTGTSASTTRRQLGSYISTVSADDLNKGSSGNVLSALQGKTAGAQITQNSGDPAGGLSVRLRGISSISPKMIISGLCKIPEIISTF